MTKKAVIVGSAGQDGTLLNQHLQALGYEVLPISRSASISLQESSAVANYIKEHQPHELYYLAAYHHTSQDQRGDDLDLFKKSTEAHVTGLLHCLEGIRLHAPLCRLFYASSSMVFGSPSVKTQDESTVLAPDSIYGVTKQAGMGLCRYYRVHHGIFASTGILYNHESPLRKPQFLSRKTVLAATRIKKGSKEKLKLGDLEAIVDWSDARDFVEAFQLILQCKESQDFVIASGQGHTVRDFVETTFTMLDLSWKDCVELDKGLLRREKPTMVGNAKKLRELTGWKPRYDFKAMIRNMILAEGVNLE